MWNETDPKDLATLEGGVHSGEPQPGCIVYGGLTPKQWMDLLFPHGTRWG